MDYLLGVVLDLRTPPMEGKNGRSVYVVDYLLGVVLDLRTPPVEGRNGRSV